MGAHLTCNNNGGGNISNNNNNNIHEHGHGHDECGAASSCIGLNMNSWLPRQAAGDSCRFSAEVYRLSEDQCRWVKVHPEVLTVKVNRTLNGAGTDSVQSNGGGAIALLEASMLETTARNESRNRRGKEQQPATTTTILSLPIPEGTQLKRYTEKFVYWRQNASRTGNNSARDGHGHSNSQVFALNLISSTDLDSFCSALNCLPPTPNMAPRLTKDEQVFEAHMAPLMALHRDRVEENPVPLFTKCRILFRERDSIVHLLDERDQLLARMSVTECIFALLPSVNFSSNASSTPPSPLTCQLSISFPARALLLQFPSAIQQLNFCRHALNASSARMAGTREVAAIQYFLQKRLDTLETVLDRLNFSTNGDDKFRQQNEAYQKPVLLCECDSTTAANRRRQSMAALLRYSMKCQIMALQENAIAGTSKQESLSNALQSSGSEFPFQQRPRHHVAHRVHLQAILNCQFSLQKTIDLLGHCHSSEEIEEKCEPSVVVAAEEGSSAHNNFTELELSTPSTSRNSSAPVKLQRIMLEILQSERIFVQDLNTLLMRFVLPSGLHFMLCVRELHRVHANFLHSLDYALTPILRFLSSSSGEQSYDELKPILTRLSTLFIAKCGQFKVYSEYIFSHMYFQRLRNESPAFKELISSFAAPIGGIRTVDSLLIKPVQRLLKYPLFLGQLRELSAANSEERALCFKALKQMRTLANWLNEMQRIQEDYGGELAAIFASSLLKAPAAMASSTFCSSWPPLADLNQLQLFAHVRWLNAASANGVGTAVTITPLNCALFVFRSVVVLLERKRTTTQHQQQQELKEQNKRKVPLVLPSSQVQLFLKQQQQPQEPAKPEANGTAAADVQKKNNGLKSTTTTGSATVHFALAIRATADGSQTVFSSPHTQQQPRLLHFECCHPAVCQHLSLALHRQRQQFEANEGSDNKIGEEEKLESAMMGAWRMEASIDSGCSSSSDRGYSSGCAGDQHQQR